MNPFRLFLFVPLFFFFLSTFGQQSETSLGIRVGSGAGLSLRYMMADHAAIEGILMYRRDGLRLVSLLEVQREIGRTNTYIFAGVGGHAGYNRLISPEGHAPIKVAGVDGIIGIEYRFPGKNLILSGDIKPMFEILQDWTFSGNSGGVTLRVLID